MLDATLIDREGVAASISSRSAALVPLFRGRFCDTTLANRAVRVFEEGEALYEMAARERTFFFVRTGVVKIGTITEGGREIIYDLRKDRDVVGERCVLEAVRRDRAVAVERTEAIPVSCDDVMASLAQHPELLRDFVGIFCNALADAHEQVNRLAANDVMPRLIGVLKTLAGKLGRPSGQQVEIAAYLTQEELSQMVMARRERVSMALNALRRRGIVQYSLHGRLIVDTRALDDFAACMR